MTSDPDAIALVPTDGTRFRVEFQKVPEPRHEGVGRFHFDLTTDVPR